MMKNAPQSEPSLDQPKTDCWGAGTLSRHEPLDYGQIKDMIEQSGMNQDLFSQALDNTLIASAPATTIEPSTISNSEYERLSSANLLNRTGAVLESYPPKHIHTFQVDNQEYTVSVQFGNNGQDSRIIGDEATLNALAKLRASQDSPKTEALW
jgi:hypothetical protein